MNIFIVTMDDPVQTKEFILRIIKTRRKDIVGLAIAKGDRLTIKKNRSKLEYLISLLLIMGVVHFIKNSYITVLYKLRKKLHQKIHYFFSDVSLAGYASKAGIKTWLINTPNNKDFLAEISKLNIDIIINQSQNILKKELLNIPRIGVLNRHNALLPKNRGRLTPFWVLYNDEKETGVSIHFVTEELDAGDIIIQKKFLIEPEDNFNTIVKKNYEIAPLAMLEALDKIEKGEKNFIKNDPVLATYNTTPHLLEAWKYRKERIKKNINNLFSLV